MTLKRRNFWTNWWSAFLRIVDSGFSRLAIVVTILTGLGLKLADTGYTWAAVAALLVYLILVAVWAMPAYVSPPQLSGRLDLKTINEFLSGTPKVGLLGLQSTGKTTFLDATVARESHKRKTEKAYGQAVSIPDSNPEQYLILIDSVGGVDRIQFGIQEQCSSILLFIDHNEGSEEAALDEERLAAHKELAKQLVHSAAEDRISIDALMIISGKSDLWQSDPASLDRMKKAAAEIKAVFDESPAYRQVKVVDIYSNDSRFDVAKLLRLAGSYAYPS